MLTRPKLGAPAKFWGRFTMLPFGSTWASAHLTPNLQFPCEADVRESAQLDYSSRLTLVKYLQGALSAIGSVEWRKGHERPAWQAPWRKNLHGT